MKKTNVTLIKGKLPVWTKIIVGSIICDSDVILWHEGSKSEFWRVNGLQLLRYDMVNTRWRYLASIRFWAEVESKLYIWET
jgi:hypothetical protein